MNKNQTSQETAIILINKNGKETAINKVQELIKGNEELYEILKDNNLTTIINYWKEVKQEIENL